MTRLAQALAAASRLFSPARTCVLACALAFVFVSQASVAQVPGVRPPDPDANPASALPAPSLDQVLADAGLEATVTDDTAVPDGAAPATADGDDAGSSAVTPAPERVWSSCIEQVPEGATRPKLTNTFPSQGLAGHALTLQVQVEHGLGETVLPNGFAIRADTDAARAIAEAGFVLPDPRGGAGPSLSRQTVQGKAQSTVLVHFVALPTSPGRHTLTLPPLPIAVSRASGELMTLCTSPHAIVIEEPIANEATPEPQPNPAPRDQREVWTLARDLTYGVLIGVMAAALIYALVRWWRRRPKPLPPPPPPRPPWEIAFEALRELKLCNLPAQNQHAEHIDRASDILRAYLGGRFGFDGIESTTDEVLVALQQAPAAQPVFDRIRSLLYDSDLVKFARWAPTDSDCAEVLETVDHIVRQTMLTAVPATAPPTPTLSVPATAPPAPEPSTGAATSSEHAATLAPSPAPADASGVGAAVSQVPEAVEVSGVSKASNQVLGPRADGAFQDSTQSEGQR